ncbi:MAG: HNH endonuclease [Nitrospirota bacterium]
MAAPTLMRPFTLPRMGRRWIKTNPTCQICSQAISGTDDSALDHIEQYWRGGKTIPENARLAHRYCNWKRSKSD